MRNRKVWMLHDVRDKFNLKYSKRYELPYFLSTHRFLTGLNLLEAENKLTAIDKDIHDYLNTDKKNNILTFDDGLKDHLTIGRILAKRGIAAVFFVPAGIFNGDFVDSHKIQFILSVIDEKTILDLIKSELNLSLYEWEELYVAMSKSLWQKNIWSSEMVFITRFFRSYHEIEQRRAILDKIFYRYVLIDDKNLHKDLYLTMQNIDELIGLGHQIGGHGVMSYNLEYETYSTILSELEGSMQFLDSLNMPKQYALANGGFNEKVLEIVSNLGFVKCYTTSEEFTIDSKNKLHGRTDFTKIY